LFSFFLSLPKEPISDSTLDYKDFVNPTGWVSWLCCSTWCWDYMYQFLDEQDIWSLVEKKSQRDRGAWRTYYKDKFMRFKKYSKNHVFLNQNGEHILGYTIHLNKNKTKWKRKTTQNQSKLNGISTIYFLQFVKSFTIYYIKCICPRIWISKVYVQELRWESMKKVSPKKT
jgi:hypothetical protein